jgi:glycosyltransferase involved in cell wall biosynthesis
MHPINFLTVAIPTHNRAAVLHESLERLTKLHVPDNTDWELLVVQNACNDSTPDVIDEFARTLPVHALVESRPGVGNARNAAVAAARGQYVIFTDDDVAVDPMWLSAYATAFAEHPDYALFGGPIVPRFTAPPPDWLEQTFTQVAPAYGRCVADRPDATLGPRLMPYGANMAFRADVFREESFDPRYGPIGTKRINGSETDLIRRILARGHTGQWVASAVVEHRIQPAQMTTRFLRRYYAGYGAELATKPAEGPQPRMLMGRPRWMWRSAVTTELRYRCRRMYASPKVWIQDLKEASIARGQLSQHFAAGRP